MIIEINNTQVTVTSHGKPAGIYIMDDFSDAELKEEKAILISQLFTKKLDETEHIYDMVTIINGVLDKRLLDSISNRQDYFNLAKELALLEAEKNKK